MSNVQVETQRQTRQAEGLALTWSPVSGVIRYGFVVGFPDLPVPPVDVIMKGATRDFAIMGVPAKYSGAVDLGSPVGEERQYGLIAYRGDGSIVPVPGVRFVGARSAPRDREYHSLLPPELVRSQPVAPAAPPPAATAPETPPRTADPWAALQELDTRPAEAAAPTPAAPAPMTPPPAAPPVDPWDVLNTPMDDERVAATDAATPAEQAPSVSIEYAAPLIAPAQPAEPALAGAAAPPADPWDVLNTLSSDTAVYADSAAPIEESAPVEEDVVTTDATPSPPLAAAPIETPVFAVAPVEEPEINAPVEASMEESPIEALAEEPAIDMLAPMEAAAPVTPTEPVTEPVPVTESVEELLLVVPVGELPIDVLVEEPPVDALVEDAVAASESVHETVPLDEEIVAAHSSVDSVVDSVDHEPSLLEDGVPPEAVVQESLEPVVIPEAEPVVTPAAEVPTAPLPESDFAEDAVAAPSAPTWDTPIEAAPRVYEKSPSLAPPAPSGGAWGDASPQTPANQRRVGIDGTAIPRQFTDETAPAVVDAARREEHAPPEPEPEPEPEPVHEPEPIYSVLQGDQAMAPRWPQDTPAPATPPVMSEVEVEQPVMSEADQQVVFVMEPADVVVVDVARDAAPIEMESVAEPMITDAAPIEMERAVEPVVSETVEAPMAPPVVEPSVLQSVESVAAMEPREEAISLLWAEQGVEEWLEPEPSAELADAVAASPDAGDVESTPEPVTREPISPRLDMAEPDAYGPATILDEPATVFDEPAIVSDEPVIVPDELDVSTSALEPEPAWAAPSDEDMTAEVLPVEAVEGAMPDPLLASEQAAPDLALEPSAPNEKLVETVLPPAEAGFSYWTDSDADGYRDLAAMLEPDAAPAVEETRAPEPEPAPSESAPAAMPLDPRTAASVAALLDEADLYLLPSWLDYAEASRLVAQAAAIAPGDPRVRDLQQQIAEAQGGADGGDVDALLQEARRSLDGGDHWRAVDLYEQVLARHPENDDARQGLERARLYGRWAAQRAAAEGDAARLRALAMCSRPRLSWRRRPTPTRSTSSRPSRPCTAGCSPSRVTMCPAAGGAEWPRWRARASGRCGATTGS